MRTGEKNEWPTREPHEIAHHQVSRPGRDNGKLEEGSGRHSKLSWLNGVNSVESVHHKMLLIVCRTPPLAGALCGHAGDESGTPDSIWQAYTRPAEGSRTFAGGSC